MFWNPKGGRMPLSITSKGIRKKVVHGIPAVVVLPQNPSNLISEQGEDQKITPHGPQLQVTQSPEKEGTWLITIALSFAFLLVCSTCALLGYSAFVYFQNGG
jgi:hypothetical protein